MAGIVTPSGVFVEVGAARLPLPVARTPVGQWVAQIIADIDAGELQPCRYCGRYFGCDCDDLVELMTAPPTADPHDDLTWAANEEIPF